jgi:hypothetical protein
VGPAGPVSPNGPCGPAGAAAKDINQLDEVGFEELPLAASMVYRLNFHPRAPSLVSLRLPKYTTVDVVSVK